MASLALDTQDFLGTQDYVKYLIVLHGGRMELEPFELPRTKKGKLVNIKYMTSQTDAGNIVFGSDGKMRHTGNCLMVGEYAIQHVCDSNFKAAKTIRSGETAYNMKYEFGTPLPIPFGIYTCLSIDGDEKFSPIKHGVMTTDPWNLADKKDPTKLRYDTLEKVTNLIIERHNLSSYRDLPIDIIPLTCSVSSAWRPEDLPHTPSPYVEQAVNVDDLADALSKVNMQPDPVEDDLSALLKKIGGSIKRRKRTNRKRPKRKRSAQSHKKRSRCLYK